MHGVFTGLKVKELFRVKKQRMIEFSPNLYYGESMQEKEFEKAKKKILETPLLSNVFLLILSRQGTDQLEVISSKYLAQGYYAEHPVRVVGVAKDREDAISLIIKITEDCLSIRKDCNLKEFCEWHS